MQCGNMTARGLRRTWLLQHTEGLTVDRLTTCLLPCTKRIQRLGKKHTNMAIWLGWGACGERVGGWVGSRLHSAQTPHSAGSAARTYPPTLAAATPLAAAKAQDILKNTPGHRLLFTMSENAACRVRVAGFIVLKRNLTLKWPKLHFVWAQTAVEFPCQITIHPPVLTWKAVLCRQDAAWNVPLSKPEESVSWSSGVTSVTYFAPDQGLSRPRAHCSVSPPTASKITSNLQRVATGSLHGRHGKGENMPAHVLVRWPKDWASHFVF